MSQTGDSGPSAANRALAALLARRRMALRAAKPLRTAGEFYSPPPPALATWKWLSELA